jgi:hypothetical protein
VNQNQPAQPAGGDLVQGVVTEARRRTNVDPTPHIPTPEPTAGLGALVAAAAQRRHSGA